MADTIHTANSVFEKSLTEIDMHLSESAGLLDLVCLVAEDADDTQWLTLRSAIVSAVYTIKDKLRAADRSLPAMTMKVVN